MFGIDRRGQGGLLALLPLFTALALTALTTTAAPVAIAASPQWRACLSCHSDSTLALTTARGERFSLAVSRAELGTSVHHGLECRECHPGVKLDAHPAGAAISGLDAYRAAASGSCIACHPLARIRAVAPHAAVASEDQRIACVDCHGSHGVARVAVWKQSTEPDTYCMACHARALSVLRQDGSRLEIAIDAAKLKASVHPGHGCADCHAGFSPVAHPAGFADGRAGRAMAASRACARCHADKLAQAEGSIHFALLRSGTAVAPGCTDCHSAHEVAPRERFATLAGMPCRGCHQQIFAAYSGSLHGLARASGEHLDAPLCSGCHCAHDVRGSARPELVRAACLGCHQTAAAAHAVWLPNAALHLDSVSCAACHAPQAQRVVALRLVESTTGRTLSEREVGDLLGGSVAREFDLDGDGMSGMDLWSAMRRLELRRQVSASGLDVVGRLEVARGIDAHRLAGKAGAVRECGSCHTAGGGAFDKVVLSLARDDGRPNRLDGGRGMIADEASMVPVHGFYMLGSTRSVVLDWLLVLAVCGGLAVVGVHLSARLWAARAAKKG